MAYVRMNHPTKGDFDAPADAVPFWETRGYSVVEGVSSVALYDPETGKQINASAPVVDVSLDLGEPDPAEEAGEVEEVQPDPADEVDETVVANEPKP